MMQFNKGMLAKVFFYFALYCGVMAVVTQRGLINQTGLGNLFADATFYLLLGSLSMLGGIYLNTDRDSHMM